MKAMIKSLLGGLLLWPVGQCQAVSVAQNGVGGVLIYPYYTVNNDLNFLYSVVNTSANAKAVKLRFLEGGIGLEVLNFNVYLSAYDVWTGVLFSTTATFSGHEGERSVTHLSGDTSCAPFMNNSGQEFLPFLIDTDLDPDNRDMSRAREGYLEVYEMANVVSPEAVLMIDHGVVGVPKNCAGVETVWTGGEWTLGPDEDPTGDLLGSATLVNVAEGMAFSYDAIALKNFGLTAASHTEPSDPEPNLDSATPQSVVLLADGQRVQAEWDHGFQAVSAVLMQTEIYNEYALDTLFNGKTEWVLSAPTKKFHVTDGFAAPPPFSAPWNGLTSCESFTYQIYDREEIRDQTNPSPLWPPRPDPHLCFATNVVEFILPDGFVSEQSKVLGSDRHLALATPTFALTENGWAHLSFHETGQIMTSSSGPQSMGLPVLGFAMTQFTNGAAAEGLLAQYGSLFKHSGKQAVAAADNPSNNNQ